jgi:hypothetical protein
MPSAFSNPTITNTTTTSTTGMGITTRLGLRDSLSSIGLARLGAEGELGHVVYNIWGEQTTSDPPSEQGQGSFFTFPTDPGDSSLEALEPDMADDDALEPRYCPAPRPSALGLSAFSQSASSLGMGMSTFGSGFSMFSAPPRPQTEQDRETQEHDLFYGGADFWAVDPPSPGRP